MDVEIIDVYIDFLPPSKKWCQISGEILRITGTKKSGTSFGLPVLCRWYILKVRGFSYYFWQRYLLIAIYNLEIFPINTNALPVKITLSVASKQKTALLMKPKRTRSTSKL